MAHLCRALYAIALAAVTARAGLTVTWNTRPPAPSARAAVSAAVVRTGTVSAVHGTRVVLHLNDGSTRVFLATPEEARELQGLVGTVIRYRAGAIP